MGIRTHITCSGFVEVYIATVTGGLQYVSFHEKSICSIVLFDSTEMYTGLFSVTRPVADPGGRGAMAPRWRPEIFFRQYINIITKPTAYDGPWEY